jgi:hypothetical protein
MRRISTLVLVALALLMSGLSLTSASASSSDTLRFRSHTEQEALIDVGKKGDSLGDQVVFNESLRARHSGDDGETHGVCTITALDRGDATLQCLVTARLDDGDLTIQGLVETDERTATLAVTGGTGDYTGASGEVRVRFISNTRSHITVDLD